MIRDLHKMADNVSDFLDEYSESLIQIAEEFGRIEAKLKSIETKLKGGPKASVKRLRNYIDRCDVNAENKEQVRRVHIEIIKIMEELKDYQKDLDWEK